MVSWPAQVFTRYHEKDVTPIRSHVNGEKSKLIKKIIRYDANFSYLYCSGYVMLCGKDTLVVNEKPFDQKRIAKFSKNVLKVKFLGLRMLILRYSTSFMASLVKWCHCLLFK